MDANRTRKDFIADEILAKVVDQVASGDPDATIATVLAQAKPLVEFHRLASAENRIRQLPASPIQES